VERRRCKRVPGVYRLDPLGFALAAVIGSWRLMQGVWHRPSRVDAKAIVVKLGFVLFVLASVISFARTRRQRLFAHALTRRLAARQSRGSFALLVVP
jgi:hypothetical protein